MHVYIITININVDGHSIKPHTHILYIFLKSYVSTNQEVINLQVHVFTVSTGHTGYTDYTVTQ